jgi:hypothetical protein
MPSECGIRSCDKNAHERQVIVSPDLYLMFSPGCRRKKSRTLSRPGDTTKAAMAETFSWDRPRWSMIGVVPRGAYVRRTSGAIMKPDSSTNTKAAFRPASNEIVVRSPSHDNTHFSCRGR